MFPADLDVLLAEARAEAKRRGHAVLHPGHLLAAARRRDADTFEATFGEEAGGRVENLLADVEKGFSGLRDDALTPAMVAHADREGGADTLVTLLKQVLAGETPEVEMISDGSNLKGSESTRIGGSGGGSPVGATAAPAPVNDKLTEPVTVGSGEHEQHVLPALSRFVEVPEPVSTLGRDGVRDRLLASLGRELPTPVALVGPPGSGRTHLIRALAGWVADSELPALEDRGVVRVIAETVVQAERTQSLHAVLGTLDQSVVCIDDVDLLCLLDTQTPDFIMINQLRSFCSAASHRLVFVLTPAALSKLEVIEPGLARELEVVSVSELSGADLGQIASEVAGDLSSFHGVEVPDEVVDLAARLRARGGIHQPGLMVSALDHACSAAHVAGRSTVSPADLVVAGPVADEVAPDELYEALTSQVLNQDHVARKVVDRLALTRRNLDLNPRRPDGVFLFVGPTGVGKTALAEVLAEAVFGDRDLLIRLDMSEYSHDWAVSRLTGPQPGFVGYTEPDGWLTTRVRKQPGAVILLDEIEKAHPTVWNVFLQVFDAGRLTDARGEVADFGDAVVIMTSNLGAEAFSKNQVGFGTTTSVPDQAVLRSVTDAMPPELVNRIDEIAVFQPLDREAIASIAELEVDRAVERLRNRAYDVTVGTDVVAFLAEEGYDPRYGGRHLQRNIERHLLGGLVSHGPGRWTARLADGQIEWAPAEQQ